MSDKSTLQSQHACLESDFWGAASGEVDRGFAGTPIQHHEVQFSIQEQLVSRNVERFRGGLVYRGSKMVVSLISELESNKKEEEDRGFAGTPTQHHEVSFSILQSIRLW